ncbi:hypothetical protein NKR23_g11878 [Pleurostoma richardsiae]|uniref:U4/U6.U5 small nuclear ribonucleoprotein 27kDa protein domain-containing protein n=1 Tax=Pleurostoma richardsiae TaxID=41990 RepID=A0AA38VD93_9PEZI|nr:hypothetical protein NKR23_g11878 [Pleurostoma richardsiae]
MSDRRSRRQDDRKAWDEPDRRERYDSGRTRDRGDRRRDDYDDRDYRRRYRSRSRDRRDRNRSRSRDRQPGGDRDRDRVRDRARDWDRDRNRERDRDGARDKDRPRRDRDEPKAPERERDRDRALPRTREGTAEAGPGGKERDVRSPQQRGQGTCWTPQLAFQGKDFAASFGLEHIALHDRSVNISQDKDRRQERRRSASPTRSASPRRDGGLPTRPRGSDKPIGGLPAHAPMSFKVGGHHDGETGRDRHREQSYDSRDRDRTEEREDRMETEEEDEEEVVMDDEGLDAMQAMMGFGTFGSTKGKKIPGNDVGAVRKEKKTEYRQYMNRVGGFNRPLSPSR